MLRFVIGLTAGGEFFTKDTVSCGVDGYGVIMSTEALLQVFREGKEYVVDGTFKVVPPVFYQLVTLGTFNAGYVCICKWSLKLVLIIFQFMPCIFCLLTRKTKALYRSTFKKVAGLLGEEVMRRIKQRNVTHVDYELALMESAEEVFGKVLGCWFHFCKAVVAKFREVGLSREIRTDPAMKKWMRRLITLPLLPYQQIDNVYPHLKPQLFLAGCSRPLLQKAKKVYNYLDNYWLGKVGSARISVFGQAHRITNDIENYHLRILKRIKVRHGNVWRFVSRYFLVFPLLNILITEHMMDIAATTEADSERIESGPLTRLRPRKYYSKSNTVMEAETLLRNGTLLPIDFLKRLSHSADTMVNHHLHLDELGAGEEDELPEDVLDFMEEVLDEEEDGDSHSGNILNSYTDSKLFPFCR